MPRKLEDDNMPREDDLSENGSFDEDAFDESPPCQDDPDFLNQLFSNSEKAIEILQALNKKFETKIKVDAHKAEMFDNMHKELTEYKNGLVSQIVNSILLDIIQVIDSNRKTIVRFEEEEPTPENYSKLLNALAGISEDLKDVLYRQGVESYEVTDGVDVRRQKIIQTIPATDQNLDKTIAKHIAEGYEKDGKVIRPERIAIYKVQQ